MNKEHTTYADRIALLTRTREQERIISSRL